MSDLASGLTKTERREPLLVDSWIEIVTEDGRKTVAALTHPEVPGLAVTMTAFGSFTVTQVLEGRKIFGPFDRASSAVLQFARLAAFTRHFGFDWTADSEYRKATFARLFNEPVPFDGVTCFSGRARRRATVAEWFRTRAEDISAATYNEYDAAWALFVAAGLAPDEPESAV